MSDQVARGRFYVLLGSIALAAGIVAFMIAHTDARNNNDRAELCILEELQMHRLNEYYNAREDARVQGRDFNPPAGEPYLSEELRGSCDKFLGQFRR